MDQTDQSMTATRRILLIEDEPFISDLYVRALKDAGYDVVVIDDGNKALIEAQTNQYDIILLDIMIPNLTGTEILRQLRDPAETPSLKAKILVTTNLELAEEAKKEIESRADGYIVKAEITPRELANLVGQIKL